jgi:methyl-accepting chemotaxis protein
MLSSPVRSTKDLKYSGSLTRKILLQITGSIAVVILASTVVNYFQVINKLKSQTLEQLEKYSIERGEREKSIFVLAEDNHPIFKKVFIEQLQLAQQQNQDPKAQFEQLLVKNQDGAIRNRPQIFDGKKQSGIYIAPSVPITPEIHRRIVILYNLLNSYGSAWHNRFQDTYIITPENMTVIYWPEVPNWAKDTPAGYDMTKEEYFTISDKQHNPERKTAWTGLYYEKISKLWLTTCSTPVDINGKHIMTIGHDVSLNELLDRTINNHLAGSYNLIFRADGRLIAHPKLMNEIQEKNGNYNILESGNQSLKNIFQAVKDNSTGKVIIDNDKNSEYLAVTKLTGPDWYFVTVFPKSILAEQAIQTARFTLLMGLLSLVVVIIVVFLVLRQQVSVPLKELTMATNRIAEGDFNISVENHRQDELGTLAQALNLMAQEVEGRTKELQRSLEQQSVSVQQTTATMDELGASSRMSAEQAEAAAVGTQQVLTLVDGHEQSLKRDSSLREKVGQIAEELQSLSAQTHQIGNISKLVSELANQTNMLALNAAVEAVRAGEQGKGFGVVASEIRKLADQSKQFAEQINTLVLEIQKATNSTVKVTDEGRKTMESVVVAVNNIAINSEQISLNAKQQAIAIQEVVKAMNALNQDAAQTTDRIRHFNKI